MIFSRKNIKFLSITVVLIVVIFISLRGADNPVKGTILWAVNPFLKTFRIFSAGTAGFFDFLGSIGELKEENERLLTERQALLAENARFKDTERENEVLRKQMELSPKNEYELEACFITAQDPQGLGNYFIIDKGNNKEIRMGMPVIVSGGVLVGRVSEVYPTAAKVVLITDPGSAVNSQVQDSGARGIVRGEYGLGIRMEMISQTEEVKESDTVITSGLGGEIPRGLLVGRISQVSQSADGLFQQAALTPVVNFSDLRVIHVVKKF